MFLRIKDWLLYDIDGYGYGNVVVYLIMWMVIFYVSFLLLVCLRENILLFVFGC